MLLLSLPGAPGCLSDGAPLSGRPFAEALGKGPHEFTLRTVLAVRAG